MDKEVVKDFVVSASYLMLLIIAFLIIYGIVKLQVRSIRYVIETGLAYYVVLMLLTVMIVSLLVSIKRGK